MAGNRNQLGVRKDGSPINSVSATSPLENLGTPEDPNIGFASQSDGNYALEFIDGVATLIPVQDEFVGVFTEQTHTTGASVIVNNDTDILYVNPASEIATLNVILPETPTNGQEVKISFGGDITVGSVATILAIVGNTGQSVLNGVAITQALAGDGYIFKYHSSLNLWRRF